MVLSEEQIILHSMAEEWARNEQPVAAFRRLRDERNSIGYSTRTYAAIVQMGWSGVLVPEEYGGTYLGLASLGLLLAQLGRNLAASPLLTSAVGAASALLLGGSDEQKRRWLPGIVDGSVIATVAVDEGPRHEPAKIETVATRNPIGWRISGVKAFVPEGNGATLFIVAARTDSRVHLFLIPSDAAGLRREHRSLVDSRGAARITLDDVSVPLDALLDSSRDAELIDQVLDRLRAGAAAEMLGMAERSFEMLLDHLKTRVQFGQPLASLQALQHRCAQLFTQIQLMRSVVEAALQALDRNDADGARAVSLAKAIACDTLNQVTRESIQLHGGIAMTDEFDAGLYLKRARVLEQLWGNAAFHRDRFATLSGY